MACYDPTVGAREENWAQTGGPGVTPDRQKGAFSHQDPPPPPQSAATQRTPGARAAPRSAQSDAAPPLPCARSSSRKTSSRRRSASESPATRFGDLEYEMRTRS